MEAAAVKPESFEKYSLPLLHKATKKVSRSSRKVQRAPGPGRSRRLIAQAKKRSTSFEAFTREGEEHYQTVPAVHLRQQVRLPRRQHPRALRANPLPRRGSASVPRPDRLVRLLAQRPPPRPPEVGVPQARRDRVGEESAADLHLPRPPRAVRRRDQEPHRARRACASSGTDGEERYTYADFRECALRAAAFLKTKGIKAGERVVLLSENSPEWGMAYFGIVRDRRDGGSAREGERRRKRSRDSSGSARRARSS